MWCDLARCMLISQARPPLPTFASSRKSLVLKNAASPFSRYGPSPGTSFVFHLGTFEFNQT